MTDNIQQIVFIDSRVADIQDLLSGLQPGEEAFVIDSSSDGLQQIANVLAANNLTNLTSISIVSHGETGELELGSSFITDGNLAGHSNTLAEIGASLAPGGNIQLYGCDVAQGAAGQQFINDFSTYAGGVVVEAATHMIGTNGGWTLDASSAPQASGSAPTNGAPTAPFTAAALKSFQGNLAVPLTEIWAAVGGEPQIVHADDSGNGTAANSTSLYPFNANFNNPTGVALDPNQQKYFVLNSGNGTASYLLVGSLPQALDTPSASPSFATITLDGNGNNFVPQVQLDTINHQIYFVDVLGFNTGTSETSVLERVNYDGTGLTTLGTVVTSGGTNGGVVGFALDPVHHDAVFEVNIGGFISTTVIPPATYLYEATGLTGSATSATITQLTINGGSTIASSLGFFTQNGGIAIDPTTQLAYFTLELGDPGTAGGLYKYNLVGNPSGTFSAVYQETSTTQPIFNAIAIDPATGKWYGTSSDQIVSGSLSGGAPSTFLTFSGGSSFPGEMSLDNAPTLSFTPDNPTFTESVNNPASTNNTPVAAISAASAGDADGGGIVSAKVSIGSFFVGDVLSATVTGNITASYNSSTGVLSLSGLDSFANYQTVLDSIAFTSTSENPTDFGSDTSRTLTWTVNDGLLSSAPQTVTVSVVGTNDAPTLAGTANAASFTENGAPVTLSPAVTVSDPDSLTLAGATVAITGGTFAGDGDVLAASVVGTSITASYNAAAETLVLAGSDTLAHYRQVLDSVTYVTASDNPTDFGADPTRTVTWQLNDGSASNNLSAASTTTISIMAVNDPPTLAGTANASFTENGAPVTLSPSVTVTDVDSLTLAGATVAISGGAFAGDGDVLAANVAGTSITASYNAATERLVLAGSDSLAHYQQVLDSVTFVTASDNPDDFGADPTRTVTWRLDDGSGSNNLSSVSTTTISITAVDDPPTLAGTADASFTENGPATTLSPAAAVSDPDSSSLASATVAITGGAFPGDGDVLAANIAGTSITASYNAATETLVLVGSDSLAHYQAVLDSVTFVTASDNPDDFGSAPTRTVTWTLNDGSAASSLTSTVSITAVDDPPTLSGTTNASFTENGAAVPLSPAAAVSDPDNTTLVGATVALTGGTFAGDGDVLAANVSGTAITASYNAATETLVLSGTDSLANYQQVLDSVTFVTASDNPDDFGSAPTRTVTWTLDDGGATSTVTTAVSITAVDDPPTLAGTANASYTENGAPVTLSPAAAVSDPDSLNLASATVRISGGAFAGDGDVLVANVAGTSITASYNAASETLVLSGADSLAHYQQVLDSVAFASASENPDDFGSAPTRTVTWTLNDGSANSAAQTTTINITAVNDPPTLSGVAASAGYTEQAAATTLSGSLAVSDPDSLTLAHATVRITGGTFAGDGDVLAANVSGTGITASYDAATETLVLSGVDTLAHYQSVLDSVTFFDPSDNPTNYGSNATRTLVWVADDGSASNNTSSPQTTTLAVTAVNDAPTLAGVPSTTSFQSGQTVTLAPAASVSDPDNLTLANATVAITGGTFVGDSDVLAANVSGTAITASYNAATETLTLTGSDTLAHYQQVLDSVTFTTGANPTNFGANPTRTLSWTINDGSGSNNTGTSTETISISTNLVKNDFDGDHRSDILFTDGGSIAPLVDFMHGTTVAAQATLPNPGTGWTAIGSGDFNSDGRADIVWQNTNGTPMIWTMNGSTVTSTTTLANPGSAWRLVGTGDFNGDAQSDLVFQNTNGTPMIWTMNGTTVASTTTLSDPGQTWDLVGTGDFNGDGKSDLVFQLPNGTPMIWEMNGTSVIANVTLPTPEGAGSWPLIGTGDFNGDGDADLVFQKTNGTPMIWEMNGTSIVSTATLGSPGANWQLIGTGDYNGDGKSDILFQNNDGTPQVWIMNGTSVTATATLPNPGSMLHANTG